MTIDEHIAAAKAAIQQGRDEAAAHIVAVLEMNQKRSLRSLCKEVDPDGWNALRVHVQRLQRSRRSEAGLGGTSADEPTPDQQGSIRSAKAAIRKHPELVDALLADPEVAAVVRKRAAEKPKEKDGSAVGLFEVVDNAVAAAERLTAECDGDRGRRLAPKVLEYVLCGLDEIEVEITKVREAVMQAEVSDVEIHRVIGGVQ